MEFSNAIILVIIVFCLIMTAHDNDESRKKEAEDRKIIIELLIKIAAK